MVKKQKKRKLSVYMSSDLKSIIERLAGNKGLPMSTLIAIELMKAVEEFSEDSWLARAIPLHVQRLSQARADELARNLQKEDAPPAKDEYPLDKVGGEHKLSVYVLPVQKETLDSFGQDHEIGTSPLITLVMLNYLMVEVEPIGGLVEAEQVYYAELRKLYDPDLATDSDSEEE